MVLSLELFGDDILICCFLTSMTNAGKTGPVRNMVWRSRDPSPECIDPLTEGIYFASVGERAGKMMESENSTVRQPRDREVEEGQGISCFQFEFQTTAVNGGCCHPLYFWSFLKVLLLIYLLK